MNDADKLANLGRPRPHLGGSCLPRRYRTPGSNPSRAGDKFHVGDRVVYCGNYLGGGDPIATIDRLLAFRTYMLAAPA